MFGDISGMMGKLKEAQEKVKETKIRLNSVVLEETVANQKIKVSITGNREIKNIAIDASLLNDKEELEDYLILALNKAIGKASQIHENELSLAAKSGMPNIPGMDMFT
ncbi:YbaB/EbfC family nucleoid-associated protein [Tenacibaculum sp. SG-28]|uniref:YbaB/EbfC family nucleoid-associated protein n=1 Tax=Tenacibaculum sp. SG-28 TaxID=754426 RepID=UPI000CF44479|nr:YbaB/EbfC family nucleoid-associated protein [Tenacibaculum sp. SG-28]PQJ23119.1 nucleoid-associated protein, YbaB/EbfC family [Tenacibaculum sp. SG-28]